MDAEQQPERIDPVEIVEAVKRGSIYLGYWVFVLGLGYTASPAGAAHWAFWAVGLVGIIGAGAWALRGSGSKAPEPAGFTAGPPEFTPRQAVDTSTYRPPAVSGGATRYLPTGQLGAGDPPHLMK